MNKTGTTRAASKIYTEMMKYGDIKNEIRLRLLTLSLKMNDPQKALNLAMEGDGDELFLLESGQTVHRLPVL